MVPMSSNFNVLDDPLPQDVKLPAFMVSTERGFLPRQEPIAVLPKEFAVLDDILQRMPIRMLSGEPGLLAQHKLGETVDTSFPNLVNEIETYADNQPVLTALYRDYSFLASAYLLEPCHHQHLVDGTYGSARNVLPEQIAMPISKVAQYTGFKPYMEYAGSYALANYKKLDPSLGLEYDNLALIRAFEHGLDRESSEAGFVLIHVDMVRHSGGLVKGAVDILNGIEANDNSKVKEGFSSLLAAAKAVNETMEKMWTKSSPGDYTSFRTFIFGITNQTMFPNGVVYKGVTEEPMYFRGESGANDSMVPLLDNLLQIPMPQTPLTEILRDFRQYRPGNHRQFLEYVSEKARNVEVREYVMRDPETALLYLLALDYVREFRFRHWCFTREYILKKTTHPTATGGSPIVKWLPNQLGAVLDAEMEVIAEIEKMGSPVNEQVLDKKDLVERQQVKLQKEVLKFCQERKVDA